MSFDTPAHSRARKDLALFLERGDTLRAIQAARALLRDESGIRQLVFIRKAVEGVLSEKLALRPFRVALLSSFSIEFIHPALVALGFLNGLRIEIFQAGFGQFRQEILNPGSGLYSFSPDAVILAIEGKDWIPSLYGSYLHTLDQGTEEILSMAGDELAGLVKVFRRHSAAAMLVHNFAPPTWRQLGILDGQAKAGQVQAVHRLNEALQAMGRETSGLFVVDYAGLVSRFGALQWYDERMDHYARAPISQGALPGLATEYMKYFRSLTGQTKKCLVLDLDDTLWGGVLGEEGTMGIQLGPNYPGSAYVAFQQAILDLHTRGVILAIASKNNAADVDELFASHPHMVLKMDHFASQQINWKPKSESLVEIAKHLNIGLEHMVVTDDNPAECEQIAAALPMVTTISLPKQPELYVRALLEEGLFDSLNFSAEDQRRRELYRQRAEAETLRAQSDSLEDFYRSLDVEVIFARLDDVSLARAAQLTQKTNQFNVTTFRYSEAQLRQRLADPTWMLITARVRDRFGDNGIVGLMMAQAKQGVLDIDTFLLSCRVIGRTVETAMLGHLCEHAARRGIKSLLGRVIASAKNLPARDLFERHGFKKLDGQDSGDTSWILDLERGFVRCPEWIRVIAEMPGNMAVEANLNPIGFKNAGTD